jgi:hypothetical protein
MANRSLGGRRNELEETFFSQRDRELMQKLRERIASQERLKALAEVSGITDDELLAQLDQLDVSAETVAALSLVPLVAVAWADGKMDSREREAVLSAAAQKGLEPGHPGYLLLEGWLDQQPERRLLDVWKGYVATLTPTLSDPAKHALQADLLGRARAVAEAAGGLLGFGTRISAAERSTLSELEQAFD